MLHDPARHEALQPIAWDEARVREFIQAIVHDTEARFSPERYWPLHPRDVEGDIDPDQPGTTLYDGAPGVVWALHYLQALGAVRLSRRYADTLVPLLALNREALHRDALKSGDDPAYASFLMGDTPILLLAHLFDPSAAHADALAALIAGNQQHPSRELMWGAPGTMLAALFLHRRSGEPRWAALFRETAVTLWSQLQWSAEHACHFWTQDLYGRHSTYLDAVHGFVATASPLIAGRHLLDAEDWAAWQSCIVDTIQRTATWDGAHANWRDCLELTPGKAPRMLMQFCHGAPGFVVCLAYLPDAALDALLVAAGEATWAAGPLTKGANLCHGTGGNGYAFLKLYQRCGNVLWLQRARAFAMHAIAQSEADARQFGQMRYSLWTGDPGLAIYLWDCIHGTAQFPTLDVFDGAAASR